METKPISHCGGLKSISDDDLCSECHDCSFRPGELSGCAENWPGLEDSDGYVQTCAKFRQLDLTNQSLRPFASFADGSDTLDTNHGGLGLRG